MQILLLTQTLPGTARDHLPAIIRIAKHLGALPKISLADASVDVLIVIILDLYGRKEEAKKLLLRSVLDIAKRMA